MSQARNEPETSRSAWYLLHAGFLIGIFFDIEEILVEFQGTPQLYVPGDTTFLISLSGPDEIHCGFC
jgi:hypothetical protein